MISIWIRAINPGLTPVKALATYEALLQEELNKGLGKAAVWVLLGGVVAGVIQAFLTFASGILEGLPFGALLQTSFVKGVSSPITGLIEFFIATVVIYLIAKALGGKGRLEDQSYLLAAIWAPMTIVLAIMSLVISVFGVVLAIFGMPPDIAALLSVPLLIYTGWLIVVAFRAPHRYSANRAILTMVLVGIVLWPVNSLFT